MSVSIIRILVFSKNGHKTLQREHVPRDSCLCSTLMPSGQVDPVKALEVLNYLVMECGHGTDAHNWGHRGTDCLRDGPEAPLRLQLLARAVELAGEVFDAAMRKEHQ